MATLTTSACGVFEAVGVIQCRVEVMIGAAPESSTERRPLRMRWMQDMDLNGRSIMQIHWVEDVDGAE